MKCEFSADGVLSLIPESAVEQFALSKWDRTQIKVYEKDWFFSMQESCKQLQELAEQRKADYQRFLASEDAKRTTLKQESPANAGTPQATAGSSRRAGTPENATPGATGSGAVTCGPASSDSGT